MILLTLIFISFIVDSSSKSVDLCLMHKRCGNCVTSNETIGSACNWCLSTSSCQSGSTCRDSELIQIEYNCPLPTEAEYDEVYTRKVVLPLIGGAHAPDILTLNMTLQTCFPGNVEVINMYEVFCDDTNLTTCLAYTAFLWQNNTMAIIFRGTNSLYQLIDEGISFFLGEKVNFDNGENGVVDEYYLTAFNKLWEAGVKNDVEKLIHIFPSVKILTLGHSLGGGLASIAAAEISQKYQMKEQVFLTTFGMPRIGDVAYAEAHDRLVPNSIRIIHANDPVPGIPPRSLPDNVSKGSFHHRLEIWYPHGMQEGAKYEIQKVADSNSAGRLNLRVEDHFEYFDVTLDEWYKGGCTQTTEGKEEK